MKRVEWRTQFNPDIILSRIDKVRTVNPAGGASFSGFELHANLPSLHSMLNFPEEARDLDRPNLIWRSLAAVRGPLTKKSFLDELNRRILEILSSDAQLYQVLTSVLLQHNAGRPMHQIHGVRIRLLAADYPPVYKQPRRNLIEKQAIPAKEAGPKYRRVIATVRAANPGQAVEMALRSVDLLRACWCFCTNFEMEFSGASWRPINKVRLGPIHTCHLPNGDTANGTLWFEPHHDEDTFGWPRSEVASVAEGLLKSLHSSPMRKQLEDAMVAYVRALDSNDQNAAFLGLWTAIERLVSPGKGEFEAFVRRCSFLFQEGEFHREVLKHLRHYRNEFVHTGRSTS